MASSNKATAWALRPQIHDESSALATPIMGENLFLNKRKAQRKRELLGGGDKFEL
jgi:hypothetical protein